MGRTLLSKAAIRDELGRRLAEFAPPGEQLRGLFVDERGQIPFADATGAPVYVVLTTNYVLFVEIKKFSNTPTRTLGTVPRQAIRFDPPDHGITHFSVRAQIQDQARGGTRARWSQGVPLAYLRDLCGYWAASAPHAGTRCRS